MDERRLLRDFETSLGNIRSVYERGINLLDTGLIPDLELVNTVAQEINTARGKYTELIDILSMPHGSEAAGDVPLHAINEAVEKLVSEREKQDTIEHVRLVFREFSRLQADKERHKTLLDEHKQRIADFTDDGLERAITDRSYIPFEKFVSAVKGEATDEELEDDLTQEFGAPLVIAIARGLIRIMPEDVPETVQTVQPAPPLDETVQTVQPAPSLDETVQTVQPAPSFDATVQTVQPAPPLDETGLSHQEPEPDTAQHEAPPDDSLSKYGATLRDDYEFGELKKHRTGKIPKGVKSFLNDLQKKPPTLVTGVKFSALYLLSRRAACFNSFMSILGEDDDLARDIYDALDYLEKEGFVARYTISSYPDYRFYCLTNPGKKVLTSESARNFVGKTMKNSPKTHIVHSAADFQRLICEVRVHIGYNRIEDIESIEDDYYEVSGLSTMEVGELMYLLFSIDEYVEAIFIPCFFSSADESQLEDMLFSLRNSCEFDTRVILIAADTAQGEVWRSYFLDKLVKFVMPENLSSINQDDIETVVIETINNVLERNKLLDEDFLERELPEEDLPVEVFPDMQSSEESDTECIEGPARSESGIISQEIFEIPERPEKPEPEKAEKPEPEGMEHPQPDEHTGDIPEPHLADNSYRSSVEMMLKEPYMSPPPIAYTVPLLLQLCISERWADLLTLAKSLSFTNVAFYASLFRRVAYALDMHRELCRYTSEGLQFLDEDSQELLENLPQEFLLYSSWAAYARASFAPDATYDQPLINRIKRAVSEMDFEPCGDMSAVKSVFKELLDMLSDHPYGFSRRVMRTLLNDEERAQKITNVKRSAGDLLTAPNFDVRMSSAGALRDALFGKYSRTYNALSICANDDPARREEALEFYSGFVIHSADETETAICDRAIVEAYINETWEKVKDTRVTVLQYKLRNLAVSNLMRRLEVIGEWLDLTSLGEGNAGELPKRVKRVKNAFDRAVLSLSDGQTGDIGVQAGRALLRQALLVLRERLDGSSSNGRLFLPLLLTPYTGLDEDGTPSLFPELNALPGFEPWRMAMRGIAYKKLLPETALAYIDDKDQVEWYSNFGTAQLLQQHYISEDSRKKDYTKSLKYAEDEAVEATKDLRAYIDLSYMNGCVEEQTRETADALISRFENELLGKGDFARFNMFLGAIRKLIEADRVQIRERLQEQLGLLSEISGGDAVQLVGDVLEKGLVTVAEEYINLLEAGDSSFLSESFNSYEALGTIDSFISLYTLIHSECRKNSDRDFSNWAYITIKRNLAGYLPDGWAEQHEQNSVSFLANWLSPARPRQGQAERIRKLITDIFGDLITGIEYIKSDPVELYEASTRSAPKNRAEYDHPISLFGTTMPKIMKIVAIYGTSSAEQIYSRVVTKLHIDGNAIVLVDGALSLNERNELARRFRSSMSGTVIVLDRVLMLYLGTKYDTERMRTLLACSLPYTYCLPYSNDGAPVSDEMFVGRKSELNDIRSMTGACLVYGGRQLGKTALLNRACSIENNPEQHEYALFIPIENVGVDSFADKLNAKLVDSNLLRISDKQRTIADICSELHKGFEKGEIDKLMLALDEADYMLEEDSLTGYQTLQQFVNLRQLTAQKFKCVFAGLHNVMRSSKAITDNSPLTKLGKPLCIKPLRQSDAQRLVRYPLSFLGYEIKENQLSAILSVANFYPGIIHLFCYELIRDISARHQHYYRDSNPPFVLDDKVMGSVISSAGLNDRVREKIHMTLHLDNRYWKLANVIAYISYDKLGGNVGAFSSGEIWDTAKSISEINNSGYDEMLVLLDEMCDMGILFAAGSQDGIYYRFRKNAFLKMIGNEESALKALMED